MRLPAAPLAVLIVTTSLTGLGVATPIPTLAQNPSQDASQGTSQGTSRNTSQSTSRNTTDDTDASDLPAPFTDTSLEAWKERKFAGSTRYRLVEKDGIRALEATSDGSASILYRKEKIDLAVTPTLRWWWRVDTLFDGIDQQRKDGDDFPARLYVVARLGPLPWNTLALNYVWTTSIPAGTVWHNPFTEKAAMIAVRSGPADLGHWVVQERNLVEDFQSAFGRAIDEIAGYAVMTDGDNSGQRATSWFGEMRFLP